MKKTLTLLFLSICLINSIFSQVSDASFEYLGREFPNGTFNKFDSKIKGSPYLDDSYQKIIFLNQKNGKFSGKYNAYHDLIEVITKSGKKYFSPSKEHPFTVHFTGTNTLYRAFEHTKNKSSFFRILMSQNEINILVKEKIILTEEVLPQSGYDKYKPPTFKREKNKYFLYSKEIFTKIPNNKSKFLKLFKSKSTEVKRFIKKEKLSIKKEKDIVKIFKFYSSL